MTYAQHVETAEEMYVCREYREDDDDDYDHDNDSSRDVDGGRVLQLDSRTIIVLR